MHMVKKNPRIEAFETESVIGGDPTKLRSVCDPENGVKQSSSNKVHSVIGQLAVSVF